MNHSFCLSYNGIKLIEDLFSCKMFFFFKKRDNFDAELCSVVDNFLSLDFRFMSIELNCQYIAFSIEMFSVIGIPGNSSSVFYV